MKKALNEIMVNSQS